MSERMAAEIFIGGTIRRALVDDLCQAIGGAGVATDWGDKQFEPSSADELLAAINEFEGVPLLWLCDDQARWGEFAELEEFLQQHGIPFTSKSAGKYEYDPEMVDFRPGRELLSRATNADGEPVVSVSQLKEISRSLRRFRTHWRDAEPQQAAAALERALEKLDGYQAELLPLPAFVIEQDESARRKAPKQKSRRRTR